MDDAPRVVQKAHGANSGRVAPEPVPVIEARVVAVAPGPEPTLKEHCVFLKEQLGLEGRIPEVISGACRALGVEETGTLVDRARRCRAVVDGGSPAAGAAPSGERDRDGGAPPLREYVRDDSARKLQGLQRQRIARAKAQEARVLKVQRAARAQIQTAAAGGVAGQRLKSVLVLGSPLPLCDGAYRRDEKGKNLTGAANGKGDDGTQYVSIRKGPRGGRWCILREGGRWHLKGGAGVTRYHFDSTADAPPIGQWLVTTHVGRPAPSVSHTGFFGEVVRDDSARKLQGLQRQRIARAKAREARVLAIQQRGGVVVAQPGAAKYDAGTAEEAPGAAKYQEEARASDSKGQQPSRDDEIGGALRVQGWWCVRRRRWTWEDLTFKRRFGPGVGICCCLGPGGALAVPLGPVCCYKLEARGRNKFVMYTICDKPGKQKDGKDDYYSRSGADGVFKSKKGGATIVFHNDYCHSCRVSWLGGGPQGFCGGCLFLPCMCRMSTPRYDDW